MSEGLRGLVERVGLVDDGTEASRVDQLADLVELAPQARMKRNE
jgi:hypothetical protein